MVGKREKIVLWTLPNPEKAICEWMRVLKPGRRAYAFGSVWSGEKGGIGSRIKHGKEQTRIPLRYKLAC